MYKFGYSLLKGTLGSGSFTPPPAPIPTATDSGVFTEYPILITPEPIQTTTESGSFTEYPVSIPFVPIKTTTESGTFTEHSVNIKTTLIHIMIVGQSQAGGFNTDPSLTSVGDSDVMTLTDGPLDVDTSTGELVTVTEGDSYDNGGSSSDVETMATSLGQQLKSFTSDDPNYKYCITVHYHGGSSIQNLDDGGTNQATGHDQAVAASARVKNRADALGYTYERHFIVTHGGSGVSNYTTGATSLIDNLVDNTDAYDSAKPYCWVDQQRVTGTPDYGEQWYDMQTSITSANVEVLMPRKDVVEYQGDGIHITNHGTRHLAMYYAQAIYDDLIGTPSSPLDIDESNISYDSDVITIPILNSVGTIVGSGDHNIIVYDDTNSNTLTGTWAVNGTDLEFTVTGNRPEGSADIEIQAGFGTGSLRDSRGNTGVIFNDAGASAYTLYKHIVRNTFTKTLVFQERILINLSGDTNTVSSPDANDRYWNNITSNATNKNASTASYSFASTIVDTRNANTTLTFTVDTPIDGNFGDEAGRNENGGLGATVDVGDYEGPAGRDSWFSYPESDQTGGEWTIGGLDSGKTYTFKFWGSRAATGTRSIDIATDSGFTDEESYLADNNTDPDQNAEHTISGVTSQTFYIRSTSGNSDFGYIGVIDIIET